MHTQKNLLSYLNLAAALHKVEEGVVLDNFGALHLHGATVAVAALLGLLAGLNHFKLVLSLFGELALARSEA